VSYHIPLTAVPGSHPVSATFAGDANYLAVTKSATLTVTKIPVKLTPYSVSGVAGTTVNLTAKLLDVKSVAMAGATLSFSIAGTAVGTATTNSTGLATLPYTIPAGTTPGPYVITVKFDGDATHQAATKSATLTVK